MSQTDSSDRFEAFARTIETVVLADRYRCTVERLLKYAQIASNAGVLTVCVLLAWTLITHKTLDIHGVGQNSDKDAISLEDHRMMPLVMGYKWNSHPSTLVLAIRNGCSFCKSSLPFYKRLGELESAGQIRAHVLSVMPDSQESGRAELISGGVNVEEVFNEPLDALKVTGTPTLLLVDSDGRLRKSWIGQLNAQEEEDVITVAGAQTTSTASVKHSDHHFW